MPPRTDQSKRSKASPTKSTRSHPKNNGSNTKDTAAPTTTTEPGPATNTNASDNTSPATNTDDATDVNPGKRTTKMPWVLTRTDERETTPSLTEERPFLSISQDEVETVTAVPVEDPTPGILDSVTWGVAAIWVYDVETSWNKYDTTAEPNRPLDMDHARELSEYMKANLKIADAPHRLCITMSRDDIEQSLHATAIHLLYSGRINAYNQERENPETIKKVEARKEEIRAAIESKQNHTSIHSTRGSNLRRPLR